MVLVMWSSFLLDWCRQCIPTCHAAPNSEGLLATCPSLGLGACAGCAGFATELHVCSSYVRPTVIDRDPGPGPGYGRDSCFFPGPGPGKFIFKIPAPAPAKVSQSRPRPRLFYQLLPGFCRDFSCFLPQSKPMNF